MALTSDQVTLTLLVVLLGLIAIIVALRIRRSEQPKPNLSAAYVGALPNQREAALSARRQRMAHYAMTLQTPDMRAPSSETWGATPAKVLADPRYTPRAEVLPIDPLDMVQYL